MIEGGEDAYPASRKLECSMALQGMLKLVSADSASCQGALNAKSPTSNIHPGKPARHMDGVLLGT